MDGANKKVWPPSVRTKLETNNGPGEVRGRVDGMVVIRRWSKKTGRWAYDMLRPYWFEDREYAVPKWAYKQMPGPDCEDSE